MFVKCRKWLVWYLQLIFDCIQNLSSLNNQEGVIIFICVCSQVHPSWRAAVWLHRHSAVQTAARHAGGALRPLGDPQQEQRAAGGSHPGQWVTTNPYKHSRHSLFLFTSRIMMLPHIVSLLLISTMKSIPFTEEDGYINQKAQFQESSVWVLYLAFFVDVGFACVPADGGKTLTFFNNDYKGEFQTVTFEGPEIQKLFYGSFHKVRITPVLLTYWLDRSCVRVIDRQIDLYFSLKGPVHPKIKTYQL